MLKKKNKKRFEYIKDLYNPVNFEIIFNPMPIIKSDVFFISISSVVRFRT